MHHNIGCWLEISEFPSFPNPSASLCHASRCGDPGKQAELSEVFKAKTLDSELSQTSTVDERWTSLKDKLFAGYKAGVRCFLEPPMEEADLVMEQPGGGSSKGETQVL